jgi:hypothetical protein
MTMVGANIPLRKTIRVALMALAVLALPACGSSKGSVQHALEASPLTYFPYSAAVWWGRPVEVKTLRSTTAGNLGAAIVDVQSGNTILGRQDVALGRRAGAWQVLAASDQTETLPCMYAGTTLSKAVFGTCGDSSVYAYSTVKGPVSTRPPTPAERKAITAAAYHDYSDERDCVRFAIAVSRVDSNYARVIPSVYGPNDAGCAVNGTFVVVDRNGTWRFLVSGKPNEG